MLKGIFPVLPTLYLDDGSIDLSAQRRVVSFALASQIDGIVFPAVASEYDYLTARERGALLKVLVEEVNGRVPIVAGVSSADPAEAIALGQEARALRLKYFMIMAPYGLGDDAASHKRFFAAISEALPDVEIILQNAPQPRGAGLSPDALLQIVDTNPALTYIKEETLPSGPRISALLDGAPRHLQGIFGGGGARYIVDELNRGALGAMPAVEIADLHVALFRAHLQQDQSGMRRLYRLSLPLLTAQAVYRMRLTKHILRRRQVTQGQYMRAPLPTLDRMAIRDIDLMFDELRRDTANDNAFPWTEVPDE